MALLIFTVNKTMYNLVRRAVSNEVRSLEEFYRHKSMKQNKKPYDQMILDRTLKEIIMLQDFVIELDRRYDFK